MRLALTSVLLAMTASPEGPPATSLADVTKSFGELQAALEIGVLRTQYAEMLQRHLPVALAFCKTPPEGLHPDAVAAACLATKRYQDALGGWTVAQLYWQQAKRALEFANSMASEPVDRREEQAVRTVVVGEPMPGRLGLGDFVSEDELLGRAYADRFELKVAEAGKYQFQADAGTCEALPILFDAGGKLLKDWEQTYAPMARRYKLKTGAYRLTVSCGMNLGQVAVGTYRLLVTKVAK